MSEFTDTVDRVLSSYVTRIIEFVSVHIFRLPPTR